MKCRHAVAIATLLLLATSVRQVTAAANGLGQKPPLGWSSWSLESSTRAGYGQAWLTAQNIKNHSDYLQQKLQAAGYNYINIDAGWERDANWTAGFDGNGIPRPDPVRFPAGIADVAAYVHAKGQKLGLYTGAGLEKPVYDANYPIAGTSCRTRDIAHQPLTNTNMWGSNWKINYAHPCAQAYINSIASRFASWGVDLLKLDGVDANSVPDVQAWSAALIQTGRPIWFTVSAWPLPLSIAQQVNDYGNGLRIDTDVECYCGTVATWTSFVDNRWDDLPNWLPYVGPGSWPDLDSMPIGNNTGSGIQDGLSNDERVSTMVFWSMASAPLWVGSDLFFLDAFAQSLLTNPEIIAVDQAAQVATRIVGGTQQKWRKTLAGGAQAVALYNLGSTPASITVNWSELGISGNAAVRDLVSRAELGSFGGSFTASSVPAHGARLVKVTAAACTPTAITPYVQVNGGAWQQTSSATVAGGGSVTFGPQPTTGGSWSWSGPNGFSSTSREVAITNIQPSQAGSYVATYTNAGGCTSTQAFSVTVSGPTATPTTPPSGTPGPTPTTGPTATPTPTPTAPAGGSWQPNTFYSVGAVVTYGGASYRRLQAHTSLVGWEPPNAPSLWARQ